MAIQQRPGWIIIVEGFQQIGIFYGTETAALDYAAINTIPNQKTMVIAGTVVEDLPEGTP